MQGLYVWYAMPFLLLTPLTPLTGAVTLDGTAVSFHESMAGTFSRAGLMVDQDSNRRLLGVTQILGPQNSLNCSSLLSCLTW